MEFEEKFGVKVDVRIPAEDRSLLYMRLEDWLLVPYSPSLLEKPNLRTGYEHFLLGSGVGMPFEPFKPLAALTKDADLEAIIKARRKEFPPGEEYITPTYALSIPNFEEVTGLCSNNYRVVAIRPDIGSDGRIAIPQLIGIVDRKGKRVEVNQDVLARLKLPTETIGPIGTKGTMIKEVFDYNKEYRIELAPTPSP